MKILLGVFLILAAPEAWSGGRYSAASSRVALITLGSRAEKNMERRLNGQGISKLQWKQALVDVYRGQGKLPGPYLVGAYHPEHVVLLPANLNRRKGVPVVSFIRNRSQRQSWHYQKSRITAQSAAVAAQFLLAGDIAMAELVATGYFDPASRSRWGSLPDFQRTFVPASYRYRDRELRELEAVSGRLPEISAVDDIFMIARALQDPNMRLSPVQRGRFSRRGLEAAAQFRDPESRRAALNYLGGAGIPPYPILDRKAALTLLAPRLDFAVMAKLAYALERGGSRRNISVVLKVAGRHVWDFGRVLAYHPAVRLVGEEPFPLGGLAAIWTPLGREIRGPAWAVLQALRFLPFDRAVSPR